MRPCLRLVAATLLLTSCSWFGGKSRLLGPISSQEEAALQTASKGQASAGLCGLSTDDGLVRMMAKGSAAVVNVGGRSHVLTLKGDSGTAGKTYAGDGVEISLSFVEDLLSKSGEVIGHKAGAMVRATSRMEHFYGIWDC